MSMLLNSSEIVSSNLTMVVNQMLEAIHRNTIINCSARLIHMIFVVVIINFKLYSGLKYSFH